MVSNSTNINKTNNNLSLKSIEHSKWRWNSRLKTCTSIWPVLHTHFPPTHFFPRKNEYILVVPPEKWVYTSFSPGKISIYSFFPPERSVYNHLSPLIFRGEIWVYTEVYPSYSILPLCTDRLFKQIQFWLRGRPFDFEGRGGLEKYLNKHFDLEYVENKYFDLEDEEKKTFNPSDLLQSRIEHTI